MADLFVADQEYSDFAEAAKDVGACTDTVIADLGRILDSVCSEALMGGEAAIRMLVFSALVSKLNDKAADIASRTDEALTAFLEDIDAADCGIS